MPEDDQATALGRSLERILTRAERDPELAEALRSLAEGVLALLGPRQERQALEALPKAPELPAQGPRVAENDLASAEDLKRFAATFPARAAVGEEEAYALPEFDAARVLEHLRLKARACLWLEAHGYTTDYGALGERLRFINEGKARGSYLRMLNRNVVDVRLRSLYGLLAENYQATALALDMWMRLEGEPEELEAARLLAEAQSALRLSAARARGQPKGTFMVLDSDQQAIFEELKAFAQLSRSYLDYLSLNRLADPAAYEDLRARVLALGERPKARAVAQATTRNFSPPELSR